MVWERKQSRDFLHLLVILVFTNRSILPFSELVCLLSSEWPSPWSEIFLERISPCHWGCRCQRESPVMGPNKRRAVGQSVWNQETWDDWCSTCSALRKTAVCSLEWLREGKKKPAQGERAKLSAESSFAGLMWPEYYALGQVCGDPLDETVLYHFRPVDLSFWKWYFCPARRADMLLPICDILNMWPFRLLEPSAHCLMG